MGAGVWSKVCAAARPGACATQLRLQEHRRSYREVYMTCPGLGEYVSGVILYKETLYQKTADGKPFVKCLQEQGIAPGIKVDEVSSAGGALSSRAEGGATRALLARS